MIEAVDFVHTICQCDTKLVLDSADWKTNVDVSYNTAMIR